jgi:hypothetical protein
LPHICPSCSQTPSDLAELIAAWSTLDQPIRKAIMTLIRSTLGESIYTD